MPQELLCYTAINPSHTQLITAKGHMLLQAPCRMSLREIFFCLHNHDRSCFRNMQYIRWEIQIEGFGIRLSFPFSFVFIFHSPDCTMIW